jgi:hypothetical protein
MERCSIAGRARFKNWTANGRTRTVYCPQLHLRRLGGLRPDGRGNRDRRLSSSSKIGKNQAISFAAYRAAVDLFPGDKGVVFDALMASLGYDINDNSTDTTKATGIGNVTCAAILAIRHDDGANQLGNLTASGVPYADYTGYSPVNPATRVPLGTGYDYSSLNPNHWQPLT